jgi:hypothetical protein
MCNTVNLTVLCEWDAVVLTEIGTRYFEGKFICPLYEDLNTEYVREKISQELLKRNSAEYCILNVHYTVSPAGGYI